MIFKAGKSGIGGAALAALLSSSSALAWDTHQSLMPWVLQTLPAETRAKLEKGIAAPCLEEDKKSYSQMAAQLALQPNVQVRPTAAQACAAKRQTSGAEILLSPAVDDPDNGMDQNLPETADPKGDRKWMGGAQGPTSQGFRHMYFGGWRATSPILTFQMPLQAVGQAPDRALALAEAARTLLSQGKTAWGYRVLAWALHFVQDLAQPFHSVQVPSLTLVPWSSLWNWPPAAAFESLVKATTRSISNYHYAYEGYTLYRLNQKEKGPFPECLPNARKLSQVEFDPTLHTPRDLALEVTDHSVEIARDLGWGVRNFFGTKLRDPDHDLPHGIGVPDYSDMAIRPDLLESRVQLDAVSCRGISNAMVASHALIHWVLRKE